MGRQLSVDIDSGFERKIIAENASVAAAKSAIGEQLSERDRVSLGEMIKLFDSIIQGEQQIRSPSLSATSIDMTRIANRIGNIYKTRFKFSQFITFITELENTTSNILEDRRITKEHRRELDKFLDLLSEFEGKEIERQQALPFGSFSVA